MSNSSSVSEPKSARRERCEALLKRLANGASGVHAVLLYGARGAGKRDLASKLARSWLCARPSDGEPCGECQPCRAYTNGNAADLLTVAPSGKSAVIKVDWVTRSDRHASDDEPPAYPVSEFLRTGPLAARNKVVMVLDADRMSREAANALLKLLEEPPERAKFVLTTENVGAVPSTIASRCVGVACPLPEREEVATRFGEMSEWEWALTRGSPGELESVRKDADVFEAIYEVANQALRCEPREALRLSERFRQLAEVLAERTESPARSANAESIRVLGMALSGLGASAACLEAAAEAHRRVLGNAQMGLVTDALFSEIALWARG